MTHDKPALKYFIIAAFLQIIWGFVPSASKFVIDEIPVEIYIAMRWTISGGIFAAYLFFTKQWKPLSLRNWITVSVLGICGYGLASFGTLYGLKIGGVANYTLMAALSPVITSLVSIVLLKERPHKLFLFALPLAVLGLVLLVVGKYEISSLSVAGTAAALVIGAYILEALVFVFSKKLKSSMNASQYLAVGQLATAGFMWALQLSVFDQFATVANLSLKGLGAAVFVSLVACVLCYTILYWLLGYMDGHKLALFEGFHPLSATLFAYFLFHEPLRPMMVVGGLLIMVGLITGNLPAAPEEAVVIPLKGKGKDDEKIANY
jgi:drug/metabolite transporter (DMT)-like permease